METNVALCNSLVLLLGFFVCISVAVPSILTKWLSIFTCFASSEVSSIPCRLYLGPSLLFVSCVSVFRIQGNCLLSISCNGQGCEMQNDLTSQIMILHCSQMLAGSSHSTGVGLRTPFNTMLLFIISFISHHRPVPAGFRIAMSGAQ